MDRITTEEKHPRWGGRTSNPVGAVDGPLWVRLPLSSAISCMKGYSSRACLSVVKGGVAVIARRRQLDARRKADPFPAARALATPHGRRSHHYQDEQQDDERYLHPGREDNGRRHRPNQDRGPHGDEPQGDDAFTPCVQSMQLGRGEAFQLESGSLRGAPRVDRDAGSGVASPTPVPTDSLQANQGARRLAVEVGSGRTAVVEALAVASGVIVDTNPDISAQSLISGARSLSVGETVCERIGPAVIGFGPSDPLDLTHFVLPAVSPIPFEQSLCQRTRVINFTTHCSVRS